MRASPSGCERRRTGRAHPVCFTAGSFRRGTRRGHTEWLGAHRHGGDARTRPCPRRTRSSHERLSTLVPRLVGSLAPRAEADDRWGPSRRRGASRLDAPVLRIEVLREDARPQGHQPDRSGNRGELREALDAPGRSTEAADRPHLGQGPPRRRRRGRRRAEGPREEGRRHQLPELPAGRGEEPVALDPLAAADRRRDGADGAGRSRLRRVAVQRHRRARTLGLRPRPDLAGLLRRRRDRDGAVQRDQPHRAAGRRDPRQHQTGGGRQRGRELLREPRRLPARHPAGRGEQRDGRGPSGRIDHHHAVRGAVLHGHRDLLCGQGQGSDHGPEDRPGAAQGRDPLALPEHDLLRARRLRRAGGLAGLLRQGRLRAHRRRGGAAGRRDPQPLQLRPRERPREVHDPVGSGDHPAGRGGPDDPGGGRRPRVPRDHRAAQRELSGR